MVRSDSYIRQLALLITPVEITPAQTNLSLACMIYGRLCQEDPPRTPRRRWQSCLVVRRENAASDKTWNPEHLTAESTVCRNTYFQTPLLLGSPPVSDWLYRGHGLWRECTGVGRVGTESWCETSVSKTSHAEEEENKSQKHFEDASEG